MLEDRVDDDLAARAQILAADPLVAREAVVRGRGHVSIPAGGNGGRRVLVPRTGVGVIRPYENRASPGSGNPRIGWFDPAE
ncbi:hypothetical protein GCM10009837_44550 [Streptomyces durmitorensis]